MNMSFYFVGKENVVNLCCKFHLWYYCNYYCNMKCADNKPLLIFYRVAQKREDAVSKEVMRQLTDADNKKISRKEKDER